MVRVLVVTIAAPIVIPASITKVMAPAVVGLEAAPSAPLPVVVAALSTRQNLHLKPNRMPGK